MNPIERLEVRMARMEALLLEMKIMVESVKKTQEVGTIIQNFVQQPEKESSLPPVLTKQKVLELTGWASSTFYQKVGQMPEGVVLRKSKKLLFNTEALLKWINRR